MEMFTSRRRGRGSRKMLLQMKMTMMRYGKVRLRDSNSGDVYF